jgi:arsenite methyltransferase
LFQKLIARQLAKPSGLVGRFTARWLNKANARMNKLTLEQLNVTAEDRILEVGFGGGQLLELILQSGPPAFLAGSDLSSDMVQFTSRRLRSDLRSGRLELRCGDIDALPYANARFTKLCTVNTIYFWRNPATALAECRRVLEAGGQILICFNSRESLEASPIHKHGFRLYDVTEVETLLRQSRFENIEAIDGHDADQGQFYCVRAVAF